MKTVTFDYSPELVKQVIGRLIMQQIMRSALVVAVGLAGIITLIAGDRGLFQGASITVLVGYFLLWFRYYRNAINIANELTNRSITVKFDEEDVSFQSADHLSIIKWSRVKKIQKLSEAWLFYIYADSHYTLVPTSRLDDELKAFIEQKIVKHGGQIIRG
ncbi:MAG: YcxB family protein [Anaerolineaceae bacterium]|nr:YcxB family protein [Anaerolineaceae bacterium]MCB9098274.1 YcxB family protein [Anaerolineales bacterium]